MSPHEQALRDILNPIGYLERTMPAGCKLEGAAAIAAIEKPAIYQEIARKALAATPAQAQQAEPRDTDTPLLHFYGVDDLYGLIDALERHVKRLQSKLPKDNQPAAVRVREG